NKQRNVIYKKRNHALFGERLALDIDNAFYIVAENIVTAHRETLDYEGFKMDAIVNFSVDTTITEEEFQKAKTEELVSKLYQEAVERNKAKMEELKKTTLPIFQNIKQNQGPHIENVVVPFTDGRKAIQVLVNLNKTLETNGEELGRALQRQITLALIDETWKEHLRAMDDLKQSVQTAYLEQKDPLVIYKITAFELFKKMDSEVNRQIVSFLCHARIPVEPQRNPNVIREGREQKTD